ncbi:hypothetical protein QFC22_001050 [Naganishia vaughanmartiniae]|uniref:Uncharacterized protein n=1 Tax=Naganishia vaughanmartiniae TaxID=1424756 RepID=A0ACC2XKT1_9TREE|nr:hypothetical protein QFC22_001050 [Naganishia vaughanmartiniae]
MEFFRQHVWSPRPVLTDSKAQLEPSDSDQSFTNFPVNQETKHPLRSISSNSLASILAQSLDKENFGPRSPPGSLTACFPAFPTGGNVSTNTDPHKTNRWSVATFGQSDPSIRTSTTAEPTPNEDVLNSKRRGLQRKLSRVRSLAEMRSSLASDSRNSSSRRSEGKVDRSSFHLSLFRPQERERSPSPAVEMQEHQASTFASFVKRKMSSDSSMRISFKKQATMASEEDASVPLISSPVPFYSSADISKTAVSSATFDVEIKDQSPVIHSTLPAFSFESNFQRSHQCSNGIPQHFYYLLPDIIEEIESRRVSGDPNFSLALDPMTSTISCHQLDQLVSNQRSVSFSNAISSPRGARSPSARRRSAIDRPSNTEAYISKRLPPTPDASEHIYTLRASGWSLGLD